MFHSPNVSRRTMDIITTKRLLDEKCQTIEQLKLIIEELKFRQEKKEQELIKHIGSLYNDLQQNKKKMAHLILKYQKQKKSNENTKTSKDCSTQTDDNQTLSICPNCSIHYQNQTKPHEQHPKYYTLQSQYIRATPQPLSDHSSLSPTLSTTDQSLRKHNESSSSAYNTAESLPSSSYSDELESLERVLNAACTMYTTKENLEHTIKLQEELFRQHLHLRGIHLENKTDHDEGTSEHFYDNIDSDTSDIEKQQTVEYRNRTIPWYQKKQQRTVRFSLNNNEEQQQQPTTKPKTVPNKVRFSDQYYTFGKRKNIKLTSSASKTNNKKPNCQHSNAINKKFSLSNMLTVTIT